MTAPQSLSAERREEVQRLWLHLGGDWYKRLPLMPDLPVEGHTFFWSFIAAIDAQHFARAIKAYETGHKMGFTEGEFIQAKGDAQRTRAAVEKTREAAILQIQAEAAATEDGETLESLHRVIERLRALSIEGTGQ